MNTPEPQSFGSSEKRASVVAQTASLPDCSNAVDVKAGWQPALRRFALSECPKTPQTTRLAGRKLLKAALAVIAASMLALALPGDCFGAQAPETQTPQNSLTINVTKALNGYYRTAEETARLQSFEKSANKTAEGMVAEGKKIAAALQAAQATLNNSSATSAAKKKAKDDATRLYGQMLDKQTEFDDFREKAIAQITQDVTETRQKLINEIVAKAIEIGKAKGAAKITDSADGKVIYTAAPSSSSDGAPARVKSSRSKDITQEVIAALNQDRPAPPPADDSPAG